MPPSKAKSRRKAGGNGRFKKGTQVGRDTRWKPGTSGNPVGLPEGYAHVRDLAKEYTGNAVRALVEITNATKHPARDRAAKALLDRGWGGADQNVNVGGNKDAPPIQAEVTHHVEPERVAGILSVLGRVGALAVGIGPARAGQADDAEADAVDTAHADGSSGGVPPP